MREYFRIADGTFVWRHIPPYEKNASKRIVKHPKGHLRDSGLLHNLLHLYSQNDLLAHPRMGHSWEAMVIENLILFREEWEEAAQGKPLDGVLGNVGLILLDIAHAIGFFKEEIEAILGNPID